MPIDIVDGLNKSLDEFLARATGEEGVTWGWTRDELAEVIGYRADVAQRHASPQRQAEALAFFRDPRYTAEACHTWIRDWFWTFDPRNVLVDLPAYIPFIPYQKQVEGIHFTIGCFERGLNGLFEKSRATGFSVNMAAIHDFLWLFRDGYAGGFGSRKEEYVDKIGDPNTLMQKCRIGLYSLPSWQMPPGFDRNRHDNHRRLINPYNGSTIIGEAGAEIGRSGRSSLFVLDEAAFLEDQDRVDAALSQNTNCIIKGSTPNGPSNAFARDRHSGKVPVLSLRWQDDPRKDANWRKLQDEKFDAVINQQELELNYHARYEGSIIPPEWVQAAMAIDLPASKPVIVALDPSDKGEDSNALVVRRGPVVSKPDSWNGVNTNDTAFRAAGMAELVGASELRYDDIGVGAGVRGALESTLRAFPFRLVPINAGSAATDGYLEDMPMDPVRGRPCSDRFVGFRDEMWWALRLRFQRTWEHHTGEKVHPAESCISIPADATELAAQLSQPRFDYMENGKVKVESKKSMRARKLGSPDLADAVVMAFAPTERQLDVARFMDSL